MSVRLHGGEGIIRTLIASPLTNIFEFLSHVTGEIFEVYILTDSGPVGSDAVFDVNVAGTTIFTDQTQRPKILAGNTSVTKANLSAAVTKGQRVSVDYDSGPTVGSNVWIIITIKEGPARETSIETTSSIADGAIATGTVTMARGFKLLKVVADRDCWIRLYATDAHRAADASRDIDTKPSGQHGIYLDLVLDTAETGLSWIIAPRGEGANMEATPTAEITYAIMNLSGSTSTVQVTFTFIAEEL